jgi:hypothetical protein
MKKHLSFASGSAFLVLVVGVGGCVTPTPIPTTILSANGATPSTQKSACTNFPSPKLISSYDGEDASINPTNNDLTDDGYTYWNFEQGNAQPLQLEKTIKRSGSASVRYGISPTGNTDRDRMETIMEVNHGKYPQLNHQLWKKDAAFAFSVFVPKDFPNPTNWFVFHQIKQHDQKYMPSPNVAWQFKNNQFVITIRYGGTGTIPATLASGEFDFKSVKPDPRTVIREVYSEDIEQLKGQWIDFATRFKITSDTDGYVEIYKKPATETVYKKIVSYRGLLGYVDDSNTSDIHVHGGIYRGAQKLEHVLYQDDVKIAWKIEDVMQCGSMLE